jgi:hypothetical protein
VITAARCGALAVLILACAPAVNPPPLTPTPIAAASAAIDAGEFEAARSLLVPRATCTASPEGREALLLLASLELDPRNERRSPSAALGFASVYLRLPDTPAPGRTLARSLYLLALELDAEAAAAAAVPAAAVPAAAVPAAAVPAAAVNPPGAACPQVAADALLAFDPPPHPPRTLQRRLRALETQRDDLARRLRASEDGRRALEKRLSEVTEELDRVRRILRP